MQFGALRMIGIIRPGASPGVSANPFRRKPGRASRLIMPRKDHIIHTVRVRVEPTQFDVVLRFCLCCGARPQRPEIIRFNAPARLLGQVGAQLGDSFRGAGFTQPVQGGHFLIQTCIGNVTDGQGFRAGLA